MMTVKLSIKLTNGEIKEVKFTKHPFECGMIVSEAHRVFGKENVKIEYL